MTEEEKTDTDPRVVEARIKYYNAQTELANQQARKEKNIADQHEISVKEAQKIYLETTTQNIQNRFYDFAGGVTFESVEKAQQILSRWRRQSLEPITLRLSSPGGNVMEGLGFFDFLEGLKADGIELRIVVLGVAASMAAVLLQAGSKRIVGPNSRLLIHEIHAESEGRMSLSEMEDQTKLFEVINQNLYKILADHSKVKQKDIEVKAKRRDWWLSAEDIIKNGFADDIGYK